MAVRFTDNSSITLEMITANRQKALAAMGTEAVGAVVKQMQDGYGRPIRQTGNLMGSIAYARSGDMSVDVGTNTEYATYVHEGTCKMAGRPYITDGINKGSERIQDVCVAYLRQGFE